MKSSLFSSILCASLMVFATGCGKDNKSGGGSHSTSLKNSSKYLSSSSKQVIDTLNRWYKGRTDSNTIQGLIKVDKLSMTNNYQAPSQECDELDLGLFSIPYCSYSYSGMTNVDPGAILSTRTLPIYPNTEYIYKKGNTELNNIFNGTAGEVVNAASVGNRAYRVDFLKNNVVTTYILDLNYHSLLNPVQKSVSSDPTKLIITRASCANPMQGCTGLQF